MMEQNYKGHNITAYASRVAERSGWKPDVRIRDSSNPDKARFHSLIFAQTYSTEKETEQEGLSTDKKWIDEGKPPLGDKAIDAL
jgi:hypothetical protein